MSHTHVAGSIHADVAAAAPPWLQPPADVNALLPQLWSRNTTKNDDGELCISGLACSQLADRYGTPVYVIDEDDLRGRARDYAQSFAGWQVYYAGKSFLCKAVARWIAEEGLSLDVCTGGELATTLAAGVDPATIGFHGNNKSEAEIHAALRAGVGRIIVDSDIEIDRLISAAQAHDVRPRLLVRVTTGVEAHTHEYISTAHEDQKFGFAIARGDALAGLLRIHDHPLLELAGIHSHIGSQIFDTAGFEVAARRALRLHADFARRTGTELPELDLGGGFGIAYTSQDSPAEPVDLAAEMTEIVHSECQRLGVAVPQLAIEPGRSISGPAGLALYRVGTVKPVQTDSGLSRLYVSVDGGMSDNIRTALYAAEYSATLASRRSAAQPVISRVVGKHCEGGDILVRDEFLPSDIAPGDLLAIPGAGAYSRSMASNYNHLPRPPVIAVGTDQTTNTLVRGETIDDLLALDVG
jgi:diaminopimelate decarboxylase